MLGYPRNFPCIGQMSKKDDNMVGKNQNHDCNWLGVLLVCSNVSASRWAFFMGCLRKIMILSRPIYGNYIS